MLNVFSRRFHALRTSRVGFTLIEILLVVSLISMIALALYKAFSSGVTIWERSRYESADEDVLIAFDKLTRDLKNIMSYARIPSYGTREHFEFAALITTPVDRYKSKGKEYLTSEIGKVYYDFDSANKQLIRKQANYSDALRGAVTSEQVLVRNVMTLTFTYYYHDQDGYYETEALQVLIPAIVRIDITLKEGNKTRLLSRVIDIPFGSKP